MNKEQLDQALLEAFKLGQRFGCSYGMIDFPTVASKKKWTDLQEKWQAECASGITIKFHRISEKVPTPGQDIIFLQKTSSFGFDGFEPMQIKAEYQLTELDEDMEDCGSAVCWNKEDKGRKHGDIFTVGECTYRVDILLDAYHAQPDDLWIDVEEYWQCFDK